MLASIVAAFTLACGLMGPQPSIEDLGWMVGDRAQQSATSEVREVWIGPGAGVLLGMGMTKQLSGGPGDWEQMRIETLADGRLAFIATPKGQPETIFPLKSYENRRAIFENPAHDFPQRVIYWDKGNGVVGARIEGKIRGKTQFMEWTFMPRR